MAGKKKHFSFSTMHISDIPKLVIALFKGQLGAEEQMMNEQTGFYEINLVPDIKADLIKAQKFRNLVFFICIVISIVSISTAAILGSVKGAQDITMAGQDSHIKDLAAKINEYSELPEFLTLQNQINGISKIEDNQKVLSRAILFLNALKPRGSGKIENCDRNNPEMNCEDSVQISEITVSLESNAMVFDAVANSSGDDKSGIDYRVLELFIKRTNLMKFDYGRYVDWEGNEIPSRCIEEYDQFGNMYQENGSIYAIWKRGNKGCDPQRNDSIVSDDNSEVTSQVDADLDSTELRNGTSDLSQVTQNNSNTNNTNSGDDDDYASSEVNVIERDTSKDSETDDKEGQYDEKGRLIKNYYPDEKIYRTPQFSAWYNSNPWLTIEDGIDDEIPEPPKEENIVYNVTNYKYTPKMDLDGSITGIPHFESKCFSYSGKDTTKEGNKKKTADWAAENECMLVPEGVQITKSANGRDASNHLVLSFSANVVINADAFAFRNKHVLTIGPNGQNVTDSYVQLEDLFTAPARECAETDTECKNAPTGSK